MACPTCDHTMHNLGITGHRVFWCPRCGTIRNEEAGGYLRADSPAWIRSVIEAAMSYPKVPRRDVWATFAVSFVAADGSKTDLPTVALDIRDANGRRLQ